MPSLSLRVPLDGLSRTHASAASGSGISSGIATLAIVFSALGARRIQRRAAKRLNKSEVRPDTLSQFAAPSAPSGTVPPSHAGDDFPLKTKARYVMFYSTVTFSYDSSGGIGNKLHLLTMVDVSRQQGHPIKPPALVAGKYRLFTLIYPLLIFVACLEYKTLLMILTVPRAQWKPLGQPFEFCRFFISNDIPLFLPLTQDTAGSNPPERTIESPSRASQKISISVTVSHYLFIKLGSFDMEGFLRKRAEERLLKRSKYTAASAKLVLCSFVDNNWN